MDINILKRFKIALGILCLTLIILVVLIAKMVPQIKEISTIQKDYKAQSESLADAEKRLEDLKATEQKKETESKAVIKNFFKPITEGLDAEGAISDEFGEILQLIRENKIKTRSVNYEYDPQDDNFVRNVGNKYHVCRVSIEMVTDYTHFENFLRNLYRHDHFLEISKIEILPYQKNKKILLISFQMKLYAQKDGSSMVYPQPQTYEEPSAPPAPSENSQNVPPPAPEEEEF